MLALADLFSFHLWTGFQQKILRKQTVKMVGYNRGFGTNFLQNWALRKLVEFVISAARRSLILGQEYRKHRGFGTYFLQNWALRKLVEFVISAARRLLILGQEYRKQLLKRDSLQYVRDKRKHFNRGKGRGVKKGQLNLENEDNQPVNLLLLMKEGTAFSLPRLTGKIKFWSENDS